MFKLILKKKKKDNDYMYLTQSSESSGKIIYLCTLKYNILEFNQGLKKNVI